MLQKTKEISKIQSKLKRPAKGAKDYEKAIYHFLNGEVKRCGKYYALPNALVYRTIITSNRGREAYTAQDIIARRIERNDDTHFIGNSSILPLIGRTSSFGSERLNRNVVDVQKYLGDLIPMLPFSVFEEASLNLNNLDILERGSEEDVTRKIENPKYDSYDRREAKDKGKEYKIPKFITETVHFTGASLFKVDGKVFLFDIDRNEIKHKIFNPFLVSIPNTSVRSIESAYKALIPDEVKESMGNGDKVLRQGEWFLVPVSNQEINKQTSENTRVFGDVKKHLGELDRYGSESFELQAGDNRPNYAQCGFQGRDGGAYITGLLEHSGREHQPLRLKRWYKAIPNTATESFTITGDID